MKTVMQYFNEGVFAHNKNLPQSANPYLFKAWPHKAWNLGYEFAIVSCEALKLPEGELERVDKPPFEQGRVANRKGIRFNDCPYEAGTKAAVQWEGGWIAEFDSQDTSQTSHMFYILTALTLVIIVCLALLKYFNPS